MFVDDVKASAEHRLNQITHTLKHVHGIELTLDESSMDEIELLHDSSEIVKNSIVSESAFNSWHTNPAYTKHMLNMEAIRLYLTEIAPKRRPRHLRESDEVVLDESHITKVGRWMMDFAEKTHTKDDKLLAMLNSFGRVGEDLVRVGQPFSPKTLKELIAYYEARIGDKNDDPDDRRQAKENLMALRMGHTMYDKYNAKKADTSAPVKEDSVEHMADTDAAAQDMDPELAALMKKYGVSAGHKMDEANKWLKAGAVAAALAGAGMGSAARAQDTTSTNVAMQPQAQLVDPHFISKEAEPEFLKLQTAWLKTGAWESREYNKKVEEGNKFLLNANNLGGVENVEQVLTKDLTDWLKKTLPAAQKRYAQQSNARGQDSLSLLMDPTFMDKNAQVLVVNRDKWLATNPRPGQIEDYNEVIDFYNRAVPTMGKDGRKKAIVGVLHWLASTRNAGRGFNEAKKAKPDFLDIDKDGNKKEPMKKAVADKKKANAHVKKVDEKMTSRIAQAINENHMQHHDYQASMARSELYRNAKYGMDMLKQVHADDEIEPWIASALTISASYLDKIYHYMDYYMNAEPGALSEDAPMPDMDMDPDMDPAEDLGETTGSIARMNLLQIVDNSIKLFHMIQPGDKLEGWVAMKLTKASEGISSSKHYLDYKNFERHASEDFALDEGRYSIVARILREAAETPEQDLQQAQTLIAAKSISDDLQSMAEKVARMGVDDLMPLVDTMKTQFGPEAADAYNEVMKSQLEELLQSVQTAKDSSDDAVLALQGGGIPGAGSSDIENMDTDLGAEPGMEEPGATDMGDGTGTMPAAAGGEEPLGRAKKAAPGEEIPALAEGRKRVAEKWGTEMKTAEKDKGKWDGYTLAELKAKKKKLMDKEERSAAEQTTVKQIDFAIRAKQKDKFGAIKEETTTTKDDRAEKAGRKVAKDIEYDERKKDGIHGAKRGAEDAKAERAGRKVTNHIEYDDKAKKKVTEEIAKAGISDELAAKKIATKIMGTPDLNIPKIKQLVTKYLSMVGKAPTDVTHLAALVATELENKGVMEAKKAKPDFLDMDKDGDKKEPMKKAIKDKAKKVDEAKSKSPYALGMWQAKKDAGMDPDKPAKDLPKKVVKKAHEIGASIEGTDESIKRLGGLVEKALRGKRKYQADLAEHRAEFAKHIAEGKVKDLLKSGQGLQGDLLEKKIAEVVTMSTDLKQQIRMLEAASRAKLFAVIKEERRSVRFAEARATKPWGVMYEGQNGARMTRFFEAEKARDFWAQLNSSVKPKLINPEHFDRIAAK
jgi:hypothetical protein